MGNQLHGKGLLTGTERLPMGSEVQIATLKRPITGTERQPMRYQCTEGGSSLGLNVYQRVAKYKLLCWSSQSLGLKRQPIGSEVQIATLEELARRLSTHWDSPMSI